MIRSAKGLLRESLIEKKLHLYFYVGSSNQYGNYFDIARLFLFAAAGPLLWFEFEKILKYIADYWTKPVWWRECKFFHMRPYMCTFRWKFNASVAFWLRVHKNVTKLTQEALLGVSEPLAIAPNQSVHSWATICTRIIWYCTLVYSVDIYTLCYF